MGRNASISLLLLRSAIQQVREEGVSIIDFEECDRPCFFLFRSLTDILMRIGKEKESKRIIYNLTVLVLEVMLFFIRLTFSWFNCLHLLLGIGHSRIDFIFAGFESAVADGFSDCDGISCKNSSRFYETAVCPSLHRG